nr:hypothetical protein [uncultured Draconibacterium sp.]
MTKDEINSMTLEEKMELLAAHAKGEIEVINGIPYNMGRDSFVTIFMNIENGKNYLDQDLTEEVPEWFFDRYNGSVIFMPNNYRDRKYDNKKTGNKS